MVEIPDEDHSWKLGCFWGFIVDNIVHFVPLGRWCVTGPHCCMPNAAFAFAFDQKIPVRYVFGSTLDLCMEKEVLCKKVQLPFFFIARYT